MKKIEEKETNEQQKQKHFKCPDCGIEVNLYGEAEQDKCSICLNK
jgi:hypothetical protein